jgi:peptidoglycan/LPS O-acetylase OafA/YrhL
VRYANVQALRFVAAVGVVGLHLAVVAKVFFGLTGPAVERVFNSPLGVGVYLFFAISGFVLAQSLRTTPVPRFLLWRAVRLYGPYWCAVAVFLAWHWVAVGPIPWIRQLRNELLLLPSGPGGSILLLGGVEWSLVYEVFFGVVLGTLALAGPRRGVTAGAAVWLALCVGRAAVSADGTVPVLASWRTIWLSAANVPFLLGVLAYELRGRGAPVVRFAGPLVFVGGIWLGRGLPRGDWAVMAEGVGCAALVAWAVAVRQLDARNPLVRGGDCSYGVYLVHNPIMLTAAHSTVVPRSAAGVVFLGAFALAAGLAFGYCESSAYSRLRRRYARPDASKRPPAAVPPARAA